MKKFKIALAIWCGVLVVGFTGALIWFHGFLKDYQTVYNETRPKVEMDAKLPLVLISLVFLLEIESSLILARHIASLTANCVL